VNWSSKLESSEFFGRDVVEPVGMPESSFPSKDMLFVSAAECFPQSRNVRQLLETCMLVLQHHYVGHVRARRRGASLSSS
jgi:hypothetical protein